CRQILATDGLNAPHFVLEALVPDAGPPDATPVDAEPPPPDAARAPPHRRRAPKPTFVTLDAYVTAEVLLDGDVVGVTPLKVRVGTQPLRFVLRAKGYAPTPHVVRPGDSGTVKLELAKPARLTLRVVPPASEIYLDGQKIGTGWLDEHITTPGAHQLELRYYRDGQLVGRVGPRDLVLEAGKESQLGEIRVPLGGPPGGSP
ncbi:MAG: hypothetical protein KC620_04715, partial [Myxococcales bacterium]|nr:hypothetical protein [Myxococcales bacterium]